MNHRLWMKWTVAAAAALAASSAYATEAVVSGDTYVSSSYPTNNFGYQSNLHVNSTSTALIVFDLSSRRPRRRRAKSATRRCGSMSTGSAARARSA